MQQERQVPSLGQEDALEKGMASHSSILAWRIPWTEESVGLQRVGHNWGTNTFIFKGRNPEWNSVVVLAPSIPFGPPLASLLPLLTLAGTHELPAGRQPLHWAHSWHSFTVGPLHRNPQVSNFQRCECASHQRQAWLTLKLALHLLLLTALRLHHLPPPLPPPSIILVCYSMPAPACQLLCHATVLFKALHSKIKNGFSIFVFVFYILFVWKVL